MTSNVEQLEFVWRHRWSEDQYDFFGQQVSSNIEMLVYELFWICSKKGIAWKQSENYLKRGASVPYYSLDEAVYWLCADLYASVVSVTWVILWIYHEGNGGYLNLYIVLYTQLKKYICVCLFSLLLCRSSMCWKSMSWDMAKGMMWGKLLFLQKCKNKNSLWAKFIISSFKWGKMKQIEKKKETSTTPSRGGTAPGADIPKSMFLWAEMYLLAH